MNSEVLNKVKNLISSASIEITITSSKKVGSFSDILPSNSTVFIAHLPDQPFSETINTAIRLHQENMKPVPHIGARNILSHQELEEGLNRLFNETDCSEFLLIGGSSPEQCGPFSSSMDVLNSGLLAKDNLSIFFAGHPESSPDISDQEIERVIIEKNRLVLDNPSMNFSFATQFCFDFSAISTWLDFLDSLDNQIPVVIGIPGIASIGSLYKHAKACGIGNSIRFIAKKAKSLTMLTSQQNPNKIIFDIASYLCSDNKYNTAINGIHIYPFGGIQKNIEWRNNILQSNIEYHEKEGFITS